MEKGYNSDLRLNGDLLHVQTEDWGLDSQLVVTRVFRNGAVIKSIKTSYSNLVSISDQNLRRKKIRESLRQQHQKILDLLQGGQMLFEKSKITL